MTTSRKLLRRVLPALGVSGALLAGFTASAGASSHREAPLISQDPVADLTDVYAFNSPGDASTVTLVANVIPFEEPAGGPNFYKFGDDVLYQLNVDNNGDSLPDLEYQFRFTTTYRNPNTFLYNTGQVTSLSDPDLNVRQTYTLTEVDNVAKKTTVLGRGLPVPPVNVGPRSTPNYQANLGSAGVKSIGGGMKVFAGPRDDPFFVDLGSIFDLGGLRPFNTAHLIPLPKAPGKDYVKGFSVHSIDLQIPKSRLTRGGDPVIGVWATTYRRAQRVLSTGQPGVLTEKGGWVQVSRLGQPLVNEVVVPVGKKDLFNASPPSKDAQFASAVLHPELASLIPVLYPGVKVPTSVNLHLGLGGREDIATIFLLGIPGVNQPKHVVPSEMLRFNTSMAAAFPNGRKLTDDVVDTEIRALAGATPFSPAFNISPNKDLGDGVNANDKPFTGTFPYLASPTSGYDS
jgi:hypothetical protein